MRTPLIAGNWKMHKTLREAQELSGAIREGLQDVRGVDVLLCPPFPYLLPVGEAVSGSPILLGAQNVHEEPQGAFTGEVSVSMLVDAGCKYVIIGHSERRHVFGESGHRLAKKVRAAVSGGLNVIYCVGETLEEREAEQTNGVIHRQLEEVVAKDVPIERLTIAYEPVWAIGTGKNATPSQAQDVHAFIRPHLAGVYGAAGADKIRILYGGSVKPGNAADLLSQPDIDGALVGGACLVAADFLAIISAARP
ncbi:MAG: triose-phosphate isomerase [Phycisphaerae bacterium]|nr:triose-phosphate isomerase [Phycisphaerae bacterium]